MICARCWSDKVELVSKKDSKTKLYHNEWECINCGVTQVKPDLNNQEEIEYAVEAEREALSRIENDWKEAIENLERAFGHPDCPILPKGASNKPFGLTDRFKKPPTRESK